MTRVHSGSDWSSISEGEDQLPFMKVVDECEEENQDRQVDGRQNDLLSSSIMGNIEPPYE